MAYGYRVNNKEQFVIKFTEYLLKTKDGEITLKKLENILDIGICDNYELLDEITKDPEICVEERITKNKIVSTGNAVNRIYAYFVKKYPEKYKEELEVWTK